MRCCFHVFILSQRYCPKSGARLRENLFVVRANHPLTDLPAERGSGGALGETPNELSASATLEEPQLLVYTTLVCQAPSYACASGLHNSLNEAHCKCASPIPFRRMQLLSS